MARTSEQTVKSLMDTTLTVDAIAPFLRMAHNLTNSLLANAGYTETELIDIEGLLAAHLAAVKDPVIMREKTGDTTTDYQRRVGEGLNSTEYGQRLLLIEHRGILAGLATRKGRATIEHIREPDGTFMVDDDLPAGTT